MPSDKRLVPLHKRSGSVRRREPNRVAPATPTIQKAAPTLYHAKLMAHDEQGRLIVPLGEAPHFATELVCYVRNNKRLHALRIYSPALVNEHRSASSTTTTITPFNQMLNQLRTQDTEGFVSTLNDVTDPEQLHNGQTSILIECAVNGTDEQFDAALKHHVENEALHPLFSQTFPNGANRASVLEFLVQHAPRHLVERRYRTLTETELCTAGEVQLSLLMQQLQELLDTS